MVGFGDGWVGRWLPWEMVGFGDGWGVYVLGQKIVEKLGGMGDG